MYCKTCYELKEKGNFCPLCLQCYQDSDFNTKVGGGGKWRGRGGEDGRGEERREEGSKRKSYTECVISPPDTLQATFIPSPFHLPYHCHCLPPCADDSVWPV